MGGVSTYNPNGRGTIYKYDGSIWTEEANTGATRIGFYAISAKPVSLLDLKPNKNSFKPTDQIAIFIDAQVVNTLFYPVFYFINPSGQKYYITQGGKLTSTASAYIQRKQKKRYVPVAITVPRAVNNFQLFSTPFNNVTAGDCTLKGSSVNAQTPFVNGELNWLVNGVDIETLRIQ